MRLPILVLSLLLPALLATSGYVATLKGAFSTRTQPSVKINGAPVEVLLHNATVVAFRVPDKFLRDPALFATAFVSIHAKELLNLPLVAIKDALVQVDIDLFREKLILEQRSSRRRRKRKRKLNPEPPEHHGGDGGGDQEKEEEEEDDAFDDEEPDEIDDTETEANHDTAERESSTEEAPGETKEGSKPHAEKSEIEKWNARLALLEHQFERDDIPEMTMTVLQSAVNVGSARAEVTLASLLLSGRRGLKRDHSLAVGLLRSAAGKGHPDAQALLGLFHASGIVPNVSRDVGVAVLMWTFAAEGGSNFAKMALAFRYFTGMDVAENCEKAARYYKQVADDVFNDARVDLAGMKIKKKAEDDPEGEIRPPIPRASQGSDLVRLSEIMPSEMLGEANDRVQYYRLNADRGNPEAQTRLGLLYYYGMYEVPQNIPKARSLFEAAAAEERPLAYAHLGLIDLRAGRNESAARLLKKAAELEDRLGLHAMGYISFHGIGVERDLKNAAIYFYEAAKREYSEAMYNLGIMYARGMEGPKLLADAYKLFERAALKFSHAPSAYMLGARALEHMRNGNGECGEAVQYLKMVAEGGIWTRIISKGFRLYKSGAYADALYRYLMAAHAGIELAQFNAAFMYEKKKVRNADGFITGPNNGEKPSRAAVVEEALQLYSMSASQDSAQSMVRMGDLAFGEGKDYVRAASAYERASKLNNAEAMFNLGWMHARGLGMNPDRHMAKRQFDMAKEVDKEAHIPATIAVLALQYPQSFFDILDKAVLIVDRFRESALGGGEGFVGGTVLATFEVVDAIVLTALLGILVVVVNARQRRMVLANNEMREEHANEGNVDNQVENNAGAPRNPEQGNERDQPQDDNRQAQEQPQQELQ